LSFHNIPPAFFPDYKKQFKTGEPPREDSPHVASENIGYSLDIDFDLDRVIRNQRSILNTVNDCVVTRVDYSLAIGVK